MTTGYYDSTYFDFQKDIGAFGGVANLFKFEKYIKDCDDVLDFGCGGGWLLKELRSSGRKIGVEVNPVARECARRNGIAELYAGLEDVTDCSVDIIISNHALEHVENPLSIVKECRRVLRVDGGRCIFVVPHETTSEVNRNDVNRHLYTWSPQNLYNLFTAADFGSVYVGRLVHAWPPRYMEWQRVLGWRMFHLLCRLYGRWKRQYQTFVVASVVGS